MTTTDDRPRGWIYSNLHLEDGLAEFCNTQIYTQIKHLGSTRLCRNVSLGGCWIIHIKGSRTFDRQICILMLKITWKLNALAEIKQTTMLIYFFIKIYSHHMNRIQYKMNIIFVMNSKTETKDKIEKYKNLFTKEDFAFGCLWWTISDSTSTYQ